MVMQAYAAFGDRLSDTGRVVCSVNPVVGDGEAQPTAAENSAWTYGFIGNDKTALRSGGTLFSYGDRVTAEDSISFMEF